MLMTIFAVPSLDGAEGPLAPPKRIVKGPSDGHGGTTAHSLYGVDTEKRHMGNSDIRGPRSIRH